LCRGCARFREGCSATDYRDRIARAPSGGGRGIGRRAVGPARRGAVRRTAQRHAVPSALEQGALRAGVRRGWGCCELAKLPARAAACEPLPVATARARRAVRTPPTLLVHCGIIAYRLHVTCPLPAPLFTPLPSPPLALSLAFSLLPPLCRSSSPGSSRAPGSPRRTRSSSSALQTASQSGARSRSGSPDASASSAASAISTT